MRDGRGSGQRPSSHMYLYQEDATLAACGHFGDPKREREITRRREKRKGKERERERKRLRASRGALRCESNDSGNPIPVASQPRDPIAAAL